MEKILFEAIDSLKYEIETLYDDLMEDNEFTEDWLRIKEYLKDKIKEYYGKSA